MIMLDSQTLLWSAFNDKRLGKFAASRIVASEAVYFSAISLYEIESKRLLGKLGAPENLGDLIRTIGYQELDFKGSSVARLREFPSLIRHDPFDRMILATAIERGLTLLTSDSVLLSLSHPLIVDSQV
jgi:PIN domain nuclease of toxin-antitoxin system